MNTSPRAKLTAYFKRFKSVNILRAQHDRRLQRTIWTIVFCATLWGLGEALLYVGVPQGQTWEAPALSWFERHFWDPRPMFGGLLYVGWVHCAQALACVWMAGSVLKTAYAHFTLPKRLEQTRQARAAMSDEQLRGLYKGAVRLSAHQGDRQQEIEEGTRWLTTASRNVGIFCVLGCLGILLTMQDVARHATDIPHWDRHIANGPLGDFGLTLFVLLSTGMLGIPIYILLKLGEAQERRFDGIMREDMLVLQQDVIGKQLEGGISRAEVTQGGELSVQQEADVSLSEQTPNPVRE